MKRRLGVPTREKLKNLRQYQGLSEEEFDDVFDKIETQAIEANINIEEQEKEVQQKLLEFSEDYDLTDMKVNDKIILRNLVQAIISLETLEDTFLRLRTNITADTVLVLDRVATVMNKLRSDISDMQDDLKLTRRIRKESQEENFMEWLGKVKIKAINFHKEKSLYIFCTECRFLLATTWLLYPDENNKITLYCKHCGHTQEEKLGELYKSKNRNLPDTALA
jgi:hypothetical protein